MGVLMAFAINQPKQVSEWVEYKDGASFLIRGIKHKPYIVANERIQNTFNVTGLKVEGIKKGELSLQDLLFKVTAEYLIEDWKGVAVEQDGDVVNVDYDKDIAFQLMAFGGDEGAELWDFVTRNAREIQNKADEYKVEVMGKSLNSTDGQKSEVAKKRTSKTK